MEDSTRRNDIDSAGRPPGAARGAGTLTAIIGVIVAGCCLLAIAAVIVLSVIPLYLSEKGTDFAINSGSSVRTIPIAGPTNFRTANNVAVTNLNSLCNQINSRLSYRSNVLGCRSARLGGVGVGVSGKKKRQSGLSCNTVVGGRVSRQSSNSPLAIVLFINKCPTLSCGTDYCASNCRAQVIQRLQSVLGSGPVTLTLQLEDGRTVTVLFLLCVFDDITASSCSDGVRNGLETGVDCGGTTCLAQNRTCANGIACSVAADCTNGVCTGGICQASTCTDGVRNGLETGVDCGGVQCVAQGRTCVNGVGCTIRADCTSDVCTNLICVAAPACSDRATCCTNTCNPCTAFGVTFYCRKVVNTLGTIATIAATAAGVATTNPTGSSGVAAANPLLAGSSSDAPTVDAPANPTVGADNGAATPVFLYINSTCPVPGPILAPGNANAAATDVAAALAGLSVVAVAAGTNPNIGGARGGAAAGNTAAAANVSLNNPYITTVGGLAGSLAATYRGGVAIAAAANPLTGAAITTGAAPNIIIYPGTLIATSAGSIRRVAGAVAAATAAVNPSAIPSTATVTADAFNNAGAATPDGIPDALDTNLIATVAGPVPNTVYRGLTLTPLGSATGTGAIGAGPAGFPSGAGGATGFGVGPNCVPNL